jgi:hypothetical protein
MYMKTLENYYSQLSANSAAATAGGTSTRRRRPKPVSPDMLHQFKAVGKAAAQSKGSTTGPLKSSSSTSSTSSSDEKPPLLAIAFVQRWPVDLPPDEAAALTKSELRVVMTSMLFVFDTPALDHLAL